MSRRQNRSTENNTERTELPYETIRECVRYIWCREGSKLPLRRADIMKHLSSTCQTNANQINQIILQANILLKRIYGYKLVQVEAKSGVQYIVVLNEECQHSMLPTAVEPHHRKLLVAALLHIYMTGGPVKEEDMWNFLAEAELMEETDHSTRKLLISTFTKQMYLSYSKVGEGDLTRNMFEWGQRAVEEVPKMFLLNKMAQVSNVKAPIALERPADYWCEQHKVAQEEVAPGTDT